MNRRNFLMDSGILTLSWATAHAVPLGGLATRLVAAEGPTAEENPNWADFMTGGSDCHQKPLLMGTLDIPDWVAEQFKLMPFSRR